MDRLGLKRHTLTCEREQTNWMEFVNRRLKGASYGRKVKQPAKIDETFSGSDWDENEMYCDEGNTRSRLRGEVKRKLIRNWRNELNVLREGTDKVFSGSRRERQTLFASEYNDLLRG
ncbi:MAG: hypothetical protein ACTS5A_01540 [Candidatus Hodgkinia cicadicola]